jgi:hypothetical protein
MLLKAILLYLTYTVVYVPQVKADSYVVCYPIATYNKRQCREYYCYMERGINFFVSTEGLYYTHYDFGLDRVYPRPPPIEPRGPLPPRLANPDTRRYPYCTVGRLASPGLGGQVQACTATLVGKHHILTASHCASWHNYNNDSGHDPMIFEAGYNLGIISPPANVIYSYWQVKVPYDEWGYLSKTGGDWLVGILDRDLGLSNGFMDGQVYDSKWNFQYLWTSIGYPADFSTARAQQVIQGPMPVLEVDEVEYGEFYKIEGLAIDGDSGGPVYGMFENDTIARIIGVVSATLPDDFSLAAYGGPAMLKLVRDAIQGHP